MYKLLITSSILLFRNNLNEICSQYYDTIMAESGTDTMDKLYKEKPEIVFMDCNYNDIEALELIKKIKNHNPNILIYFFVGSLNKKEASGAMELDIMEICKKPVQNITIEQILKKIPKNHIDKLEKCQKFYEEKYPSNLGEMVFDLEEVDEVEKEVPKEETKDSLNFEISNIENIDEISFEFIEQDEDEEEDEQPQNILQSIDFEEEDNVTTSDIPKEDNVTSTINTNTTLDDEKTKEITQYIAKELSALIEDKKLSKEDDNKKLKEGFNQVQENITSSINRELNRLLSKKQDIDMNSVVLQINNNFKDYEQRLLSKLNNSNISIDEINKMLETTNQTLNKDLQNLFLSYNENLIVVLEDILTTNQKLVKENKLLMEQYNSLLVNQQNQTQLLLKELVEIKTLINDENRTNKATNDTMVEAKTDIKPKTVVLENNNEYNQINQNTNDSLLVDKSTNKDDDLKVDTTESNPIEFIEEPEVVQEDKIDTLEFEIGETPNTSDKIDKSKLISIFEEEDTPVVEQTKNLPDVVKSGPLIKPSVYNVFQDIPVKDDDENIGLIHFDDEEDELNEEQDKKMGVLKSLFFKKH